MPRSDKKVFAVLYIGINGIITLCYLAGFPDASGEFIASLNFSPLVKLKINESMETYGSLKLLRLELGKVGFERTIQTSQDRRHVMRTLSKNPPVFEIDDFLNTKECEALIEQAKLAGLSTSTVMDEGIENDMKTLSDPTEPLSYFQSWDRDKNGNIDMKEARKTLETYMDFDLDPKNLAKMFQEIKLDFNYDSLISKVEFTRRNVRSLAESINRLKNEMPQTKSRHSQTTWIDTKRENAPSAIADLQERLSKLTGLPLPLIRASEPVQVVHYEPGGHYNCHLDSDYIEKDRPCCHFVKFPTEPDNCRLCRYITVLYFLNDVELGGETAFPIAGNGTLSREVWAEDSEGLCNLARNCHKSNVVVQPKRGKAILWYNHLVNDTTGWGGELDEFSFHGGCDVIKGFKWIANNWINVGYDRTEDIENWVLASTEHDKWYQSNGDVHDEL